MPDVGKIYKILEILQEYAQTGISNKEISRELGLPPSTCSRILNSLKKYDFVYRRDSDMRFFLGYAHLRFAQTLLAHSDEVALCRPILDDLYPKLEETAYYAKLNGDYCVVVDVRGSVNTRIAVGLGELMPLHCSAAGKAALAFIPEYEQKKILRRLPVERYTRNTKIDIAQLEEELMEIAKSHISYNYGEYHEGINAVATPVFNRFGVVTGSIGMVGTSARLETEIMKKKAKLLMAASRQVSEQLIRGEVT
ncbi:MAG: IclR family transcriptional regulator [Spirochaetaceae bacterium]